MMIIGEDDLALGEELLSKLKLSGSSRGFGGMRGVYVGGPCQIQLPDSKGELKAFTLDNVKFHPRILDGDNGSIIGMYILKAFKISFSNDKVFLDL